jgi:hypothetical protein
VPPLAFFYCFHTEKTFARHRFAIEIVKLFVVVLGAGHAALPVQTVETDCATVPDIVVALVTTSDSTAVLVVVIVFAPEGARTASVQVSVTALPDIEPMIEFVTMTAPAGALPVRVPEIDEPT